MLPFIIPVMAHGTELMETLRHGGGVGEEGGGNPPPASGKGPTHREGTRPRDSAGTPAS